MFWGRLITEPKMAPVVRSLLDCPNFRDNRESLWSNLNQKVIACNLSDGMQISHFFNSSDTEQRILSLLGEGGSSSPF